MKKINLVFFIWILSLYLIGVLAYLFFEFNHNGGIFFQLPIGISFTKIVSMFAQWDGGNYLLISKYGYVYEHFFAYFPLYPAIIGLLDFAISPIIIGAIISIICGLLFIHFYIRYTQDAYRLPMRLNQLLAIILFPPSFILICVYPESLFLLLSTLSAYLTFVKKQYFPAVIFASLASITRVHGLIFLFLIDCNLIFIKNLSIIQRTVLIIVSAVPILSLMFAQFIFTGNPLSFLTAQSHWQRFSLPEFAIQFDYIGIITLINTSLVITVFYFVSKYISRLKKFDRLYLVVSIIIPILTGSLDSMPRYLLSSYPVYLILFFAIDRFKLKMLITYGFIVLQSFYLSLFLSGYWTF